MAMKLAVRAGIPLAMILISSGFQAPKPAGELVAVVRTYLGLGLPTDWEGIEKLPGFTWGPLPPTELKNCLPNGDCFARQGRVAIAGRSFTIVATGARTMVINLMFRNMGPAIGEALVVAELREAGLGAELARCPVGARGGTSWYRLTAPNLATGFLAIQPAGPGLTRGSWFPRATSCHLCNPTSSRFTASSAPPVPSGRPWRPEIPTRSSPRR